MLKLPWLEPLIIWFRGRRPLMPLDYFVGRVSGDGIRPGLAGIEKNESLFSFHAWLNRLTQPLPLSSRKTAPLLLLRKGKRCLL